MREIKSPHTARNYGKSCLISAKLMIWGHRDPEINPAVTKEGKGLES